MRIEEVDESSIRRRNVAVNNEEYEEYNSGEEYITDEEYEDDLDEYIPSSKKSFRQHIANVVAALAPRRIASTIKGSSNNLAIKGKALANNAGNLAWILSTSLILVGVPVLFAYDREKNMAAQGGQLAPLDGPAS